MHPMVHVTWHDPPTAVEPATSRAAAACGEDVETLCRPYEDRDEVRGDRCRTARGGLAVPTSEAVYAILQPWAIRNQRSGDGPLAGH